MRVKVTATNSEGSASATSATPHRRSPKARGPQASATCMTKPVASRPRGRSDPGRRGLFAGTRTGTCSSIQRYSASTLAVLQTTPAHAPPGTQVDITGTGFSTEASQRRSQLRRDPPRDREQRRRPRTSSSKFPRARARGRSPSKSAGTRRTAQEPQTLGGDGPLSRRAPSKVPPQRRATERRWPPIREVRGRAPRTLRAESHRAACSAGTALAGALASFRPRQHRRMAPRGQQPPRRRLGERPMDLAVGEAPRAQGTAARPASAARRSRTACRWRTSRSRSRAPASHQDRRSGRFLLNGLPAGHQVLVIDGKAPTRPPPLRPVHRRRRTRRRARRPRWATHLDDAARPSRQHAIQPALKHETVLTNPRIPGLEVAAGGNDLRSANGALVHVNLTAIPWIARRSRCRCSSAACRRTSRCSPAAPI